jgi:long-chain fatty acid transport protein
MRMKKTCLGLLVVLLSASGLLAYGLNLNGFGARAMAMGGAFVGLADDYTAVFWNPAGLAQLKKGTFGLVGHGLLPSSDYSLGDFSMKTNAKLYPAGLVGFFQPVGDNVVVGVGAYTLSGLGQDWNNTGLEEALVYPIPPAAFTPELAANRWRSFIGSITIAPSIAIRLSEQFFVGATFNINYGFFKIDQWGETYDETALNFGQRTMDIKGWGYGATFGALIKPSDMVSFGITYRLQSRMKLSGTTTIENLHDVMNILNPSLDLPNTSATKMDVYSPMWLAGGIALKPVKDLTLTFDVQWTNWKKLDVLTLTFTDPAWVGAGLSEGTMTLDWADKFQIRGGLEYKMGNLALRAGYYNDPVPSPDATMNILVPGFTYNSVIGGLGYTSGGLHVDAAVEYLTGQKRTITEATGDNMPGIYTMKILVPIVSIGYGW